MSRGDVTELLGDSGRPFTGHIALNFSDDEKPRYPRRLQALLEYRTAVSTARVMAWSDIWNARAEIRKVRDELAGFFAMNRLYPDHYLGGPEVTYRCHYRIWFKPPLMSYVSVTNSGTAEDYQETVLYQLRLFNSRGEVLVYRGSLAPNATDFGPINRFFPSVGEFFGPKEIGIASVESRADLAVMHFTSHQKSGVFSAEHFLPSVNRHEGKIYACCGS